MVVGAAQHCEHAALKGAVPFQHGAVPFSNAIQRHHAGVPAKQLLQHGMRATPIFWVLHAG